MQCGVSSGRFSEHSPVIGIDAGRNVATGSDWGNVRCFTLGRVMFYELCLLVISLPLFGSAKNPKRAQEPGGLQWRIRFIELRGRERVSLGNDWLAVCR